MARSAADLALSTQVIQTTTIPSRDYSTALTRSLKNFRLGFVDEHIWRMPAGIYERNDEATEQMVSRLIRSVMFIADEQSKNSGYHEAMSRIKQAGGFVQYAVGIPKGGEICSSINQVC